MNVQKYSRRETVIICETAFDCALLFSLSVLDFEDLKIVSSRDRFDFSRRISGVINGLDGVDETEEVFVGAC